MSYEKTIIVKITVTITIFIFIFFKIDFYWNTVDFETDEENVDCIWSSEDMEESFKPSLDEDYVEDVHQDFKQMLDSFKYNGAQYRGARVPNAIRGYLNQANIPDNMRLKWFELEDLSNGDDLNAQLTYITQQPFDGDDANEFIREAQEAFEGLAERFGFDKPFSIALDVRCRDGAEYGQLVYDLEIDGEIDVTEDVEESLRSIVYKILKASSDVSVEEIVKEVTDRGRKITADEVRNYIDEYNHLLSRNVINKNKFLDFISDHETAREDFIRYFDLREVNGEINIDDIDQEHIADWVADHEQLKDDYDRYLKSNSIKEEYNEIGRYELRKIDSNEVVFVTDDIVELTKEFFNTENVYAYDCEAETDIDETELRDFYDNDENFWGIEESKNERPKLTLSEDFDYISDEVKMAVYAACEEAYEVGHFDETLLATIFEDLDDQGLDYDKDSVREYFYYLAEEKPFSLEESSNTVKGKYTLSLGRTEETSTGINMSRWMVIVDADSEEEAIKEFRAYVGEASSIKVYCATPTTKDDLENEEIRVIEKHPLNNKRSTNTKRAEDLTEDDVIVLNSGRKFIKNVKVWKNEVDLIISDNEGKEGTITFRKDDQVKVANLDESLTEDKDEVRQLKNKLDSLQDTLDWATEKGYSHRLTSLLNQIDEVKKQIEDVENKSESLTEEVNDYKSLFATTTEFTDDFIDAIEKGGYDEDVFGNAATAWDMEEFGPVILTKDNKIMYPFTYGGPDTRCLIHYSLKDILTEMDLLDEKETILADLEKHTGLSRETLLGNDVDNDDYLKQLAKDDYDCGLSFDSFDDFKDHCNELDLDVTEDDFKKYLNYVADCREEANNESIEESREDIYNPDSEVTFKVLSEAEDILVTYQGTQTKELIEYVNSNEEAFYVVKIFPMEMDGFGYIQPETYMAEETVFDRSCDDELTFDMLVEGAE